MFNVPMRQRSQITSNFATAHTNGILTDETLLLMTDAQLKELAYTKNGVAAEEYRASLNPKVALDQGHTAGQYYLGVHRAKLLLDQRMKERITELQQRKAEDLQANNALAYAEPNS